MQSEAFFSSHGLGRVWIAISIFCGFLAPCFAEATLVAPLSLSELKEASSDVIRGRVMGLEWDSDGRRYAVVRVAEQWKGSALPLSTLAPSLASGQEFRVATLERRFNHGTIIERTLGAPDYRRGQDVVLFVKPWGSAQNYLPMGLMQGVFLIERVGSLERVRSRAAHDGTHLPKIDGSHLQVKSESEENYLHDISKDWGDLDSFRKKVKSL